jgi:hypothetical protein
VSRTSRIPYHQNVYDLLGIEPGESPQAARMIAEHEARHGPLPASVREWYLHNHLFRISPLLMPLTKFLEEAATGAPEEGRRCADVLVGDGGRWMVYLDDSDDPAVWTDAYGMSDNTKWDRETERFSDFVDVIDGFSEAVDAAREPGGPHWLIARDEPFQPPVIDFLTEHFGEPERTARPGNVTTYTYRPLGGTIRVTADEPTLTGGLSAWWVHADTPERLAEFAELLLPWGTLRDTLRADTNPASAVLKRVRAA